MPVDEGLAASSLQVPPSTQLENRRRRGPDGDSGNQKSRDKVDAPRCAVRAAIQQIGSPSPQDAANRRREATA